MAEHDTQTDASTDPEQIGDRIAAILDAAETSAGRIRSDAQSEAGEIIRRAHSEAAARVAELTREPQRLRDEAAADAERTRQAGEEQARNAIAKADHDASAIRAAAEAEAHRLEAEAQSRVQELAAEARTLTQIREGAAREVRDTIGALRHVADQLDLQLLAQLGTSSAPARTEEAQGWRRLWRRSGQLHDGELPALGAGTTPSDDMHARVKEASAESAGSTRPELVKAAGSSNNGEQA